MLKAAGTWGGILTLIALAIVVFRQLVLLIGVLTFAIKALLVLAFLALLIGVAYMIYSSWKQHRKEEREL
jgi:threonine/homoserine/homoserine lactone efflux protein